MYCDRIKKKVINPKPKIKIKKISQSISYIDANNSIGFVAADIGIKQAIINAKKTGIGLVGIKNSGHYGLSGYYAEQAVKKNLIVLCFTNAPPAIAPHGSRKKLFGNISLSNKKPKTKNEILSLVWNYSSDADTHTVETHIYRLRKKILDKFSDEKFILNNKRYTFKASIPDYFRSFLIKNNLKQKDF